MKWEKKQVSKIDANDESMQVSKIKSSKTIQASLEFKTKTNI